MSALRSAPRGHAIAGWGAVAIAFAAAWVAPVLPGALMLGLAPRLLSGDLALAAMAIGTAFVFSPLYSWIGLVIALPMVVGLMSQGRFGWAMALAAGLAAGVLATPLVGGLGPLVAPMMGAAMLSVLHAVLRAARPAAFL